MYRGFFGVHQMTLDLLLFALYLVAGVISIAYFIIKKD
jgi:hypothetical protein